jgi:hypothetical protein
MCLCAPDDGHLMPFPPDPGAEITTITVGHADIEYDSSASTAVTQ